MRVDTPEAWDAQMASASSDPDNILADARIVYELKSLVVMGQCYDVVDSRPPNGLQIQLEGTASDTLVMQNLGAAAASSFAGCRSRPSRRWRRAPPISRSNAVDASPPAQATSSSVHHRAPGK